MENLNAKAIKSELEGLVNFHTCPEYIKNALALINSQEQKIKELNEENERLIEELEKACKVNFYCSFTKSKIQNCPIDDEVAKAKADTVRKMHSEIKERCIKGGIYPAFVASTIDQIAKEILEGVGNAGE